MALGAGRASSLSRRRIGGGTRPIGSTVKGHAELPRRVGQLDDGPLGVALDAALRHRFSIVEHILAK
jgi:hypothetical protein